MPQSFAVRLLPVKPNGSSKTLRPSFRYAKLSKEVRQKIMFPDSATTTELIPQTTVTTVSTGNPDERIYLAPDLEYAMIPVTDASGHTVVQQVSGVPNNFILKWL